LWFRYLFSIVCFGIWILLAKVKWPQTPREWFHLSVTGVLMHAGYLGGVWAAVKAGMGSGLSALIVGLQPVLTAIWLSSHGAQSESHVSRRQWLGLLLGFLGLVLVVWRKLTQGSAMDHVTVVNLAFAVMALLAITLGTLYQKSFVKPCDVRTANTVQLLAAMIATTPLAWLETETMQWTPEMMGAMAWFVLGLTLGGSSLLYMLIQKGAAASVTSLMYLVPPCTALMAWFLFDEPITIVTLLGIALTAWGVSWVIRPAKIPEGEKL
jgi:drug/metabolite transporter (DMT)-like permease